MAVTRAPQNGSARHWTVVRPEPPGQFTAQAVGLPDITATASTREEALERVHEILSALLDSGQLVPVEVGSTNPILEWFGRLDPNDPNEQAYLEELARSRQEDRERTNRELDQECSNSSSTPTT